LKKIDDYLEEKEKILWKHEKIVNLLDLKVYFIGNFIIVFLMIFSSLLVLFFIPSDIGVIIIFFLLMIIGFALLTIVTIKSNKERRKIIQLPKEQLKIYPL
jgi:succinate-acetate transporter protein